MNTVLEITIKPTSKTTFDVEVYEPESGECTTIHCHDTGNTTDAENLAIVYEIRSWVSLLREKEDAQ